MRKRLAGGLLGSLALSVALAGAAVAAPGGNKAGDTLVNVQVSNLAVLVPVAVAANLCDINVNVLAAQALLGPTTCEADAESAASPGWNSGGGNKAGNSLINVQLDNVIVAVPISLALNICDLDVNVLARQFAAGDTSCVADAIATAN